MPDVNQILIFLHFVGLTMGFSVSYSNLVMSGLIASAKPEDRPTLARFPPRMTRVGDIGLVLLWATGIAMLLRLQIGLADLPWQFKAKLACVVLLTITIGCIHSFQGQIRRGNHEAAAKIHVAGKVASLFALAALALAVLAVR